MSILPTAPEALARSIEAFAAGDRDAARYWLDVAAELREGHRVHAGPSPSPRRRDDVIAWTPATDATAVMQQVTGTLECKACGREMIYRPDGLVHRSTYRTECEPAVPADDAAAAESDATAVLTPATGRLECKACGKELIDGPLPHVHRSTYRVECDPVDLTDRWHVFSSSASSR